MTLSGESASAQLATDPTATGTIVDDDAAPIVVTPSADALVSNVGQSQSPVLDGGSVAHERQVARGTGSYREGGGCTADDNDSPAVNCAGEVEATLTDRLSAWAAAGYGAGELRLTPSGGSPFTADLTMVRVAREWSPDGAMRARVCWRVDKSLALMNGGYRELLKE